MKRGDVKMTAMFRHIRAWIAAVALATLLQPCSASLAAFTDSMIDRGANTTYVMYDNTNGLPTSEANDIVQTDDGFIWIGSYSGLIRHDGNTFERFDASTGVASVVCLFVDSEDRLWIGTNDSGLARYEKGSFIFFNKKDGLRSLSIRTIAEDGDHDIVFGTTKGVAYISDGTVRYIDEPRLNNEYIKQLRSDESGRILGVTYDGDVFIIEDKKITDYISTDDSGIDSVCSICPDPKRENFAYVGSDNNYVWYGNVTESFRGATKYMTGDLAGINSIRIEEGATWICADNGAGWLDRNHVFRQLKNIPLNNSVDNMITDHEGNRWFVSSRQGVMKVVEDQFTDISKLAGLDPMVVNTTCKIGDDLYAGTDNGLVILDREFRQKENILTRELKGVRIRCLTKDDKGDLWICTYNGEKGLVCYTADNDIKSYTEQNGLISNWVRSAVQLSDGRIAVANSGGVIFIKDGEITEKYTSEDGLSNPEILTICEGRNGEVYLGSDGDGIYVLKDKNVSRLGEDDGLPSEVVLRMRYDKKRDLFWVITSNSIAKMKDNKIEKINNFPYPNNFDVVFDNNGAIWVLASNGIYVVDGDKLEANGKQEYQFYNSDLGLPCVATANSWSYIDEEGNLYIAGSTGIASVNIYNTVDDAQNVILRVPYLDVDGERYYVENNYVKIPRNTQRIVIHGFAITYSLKNPKIVYKLEGFDEEEGVVDKRELEPVTYTNLSGGVYRFRLSVEDPVTARVVNTMTIAVEKELRWHESVWFWIIAGLVAIVIVIVIGRIVGAKRVASAERKTRETQDFVDQTISAFAKLIDAKDKYTQGHSRRVAEYTERLARKLGFDEEEIRKYKNIALLHDIGKVAIPDDILNKPEGLTDEEYEIMKSHAARGKDILDEIRSEPDLALGAGYHHERFDGKGYPDGLTGETIPPVAQLIAVADTFDAMYSTRPYRKQLPLSVVLEELKNIAGTQLNKEYVQAFLQLAEEGELVNLEEAKRREESDR